MEVPDPEKIEKILKLIESFQQDSKIYEVEGISFNDILSQNINELLSEIRHEKMFLFTLYTDEPNLLFVIGKQDTEKVLVVCFQNSYEKHKESIRKAFPNAKIELVEDTSNIIGQMPSGVKDDE